MDLSGDQLCVFTPGHEENVLDDLARGGARCRDGLYANDA